MNIALEGRTTVWLYNSHREGNKGNTRRNRTIKVEQEKVIPYGIKGWQKPKRIYTIRTQEGADKQKRRFVWPYVLKERTKGKHTICILE